MTVVARPMEEKKDRLDTYASNGQNTTADTENQEATPSPSFKSYQGDLFEVCTEFDLHSVMAQTE